ncbi:hypothetical protein AVEN_18657-2 [Araneus ventricosus]|uniref:Uncharacterized protein n=1 Tax=Araneus ventricosus TaxID=182803 RepID=A0A4Y2RPS4_ARAVE|nr:hypothetical protein AVEN_18657-2 [Araneus ventricosus]
MFLKLVNDCIQHFKILKPENERIERPETLCKFNFSDPNLYNDKSLGFGFRICCRATNKRKEKKLGDKDVFALRQDSRKNVITMIKHFMQKCPVNYALVRPAICIDPRVMAGYPEKAQQKMKKRVNNEFIKLSGAIYDLKITKEMRTAATSVRAKYMQYLESERSKEKTETKSFRGGNRFFKTKENVPPNGHAPNKWGSK